MKPRSKEELLHGIKAFWTIVTVAKCRKYIRHLKNMILEVIKVMVLQQDIEETDRLTLYLQISIIAKSTEVTK